jgi:hypothetical protein
LHKLDTEWASPNAFQAQHKKKKKWFEHALTLHYQSYNSLSIQKMQEEIQLLHVPVYLVRS